MIKKEGKVMMKLSMFQLLKTLKKKDLRLKAILK